MKQPDLLQALLPVVRALDRLGVQYMIGGSVASSALGVARTTLDVDLVADLATSHAPALVQALGQTYYIDQDMIEDAVRRHACFNVVHLETMLKVDVFTLKDRRYDQEAFARRQRERLDEDPSTPALSLASAEDTILNKLEWYKLGNNISERQWHDVLGVLKVQRDALDGAYLLRCASEIGVLELLRRACAEAGLSTLLPREP